MGEILKKLQTVKFQNKKISDLQKNTKIFHFEYERGMKKTRDNIIVDFLKIHHFIFSIHL